MREIKFRAWDEIEKKMWEPIVGKNGVLMAQNQIGGFVSFPPYQDPLMQYTGLHDKDGKEIYEGDIVKGHGVYSGIVTFNDNNLHELPAFHICDSEGKAVEYYLGEPPSCKHEVIGNIYENPELLENKP